MIGYGGRVASCAPTALLDSIRGRLFAVQLAAPGLERHVALVSLLLSAGELAQGLADRAFEERGYDGGDPAADLAMVLAVALARQVWRSHRTGYTHQARIAEARAALWRLARITRNDPINIRSAEGFQHYGVYPETFGAAAAALAGHAPALIVGIRTIGTTLAAAVAGVFSRRKAPLTVRPVGHPFDRQLALGVEATRALTLARRLVAVVDEGPGLSGSSFGSVLDALEEAGVPETSVRLFPSHLTLGARASERTRTRWERLARHWVPFEAELLAGGQTGLAAWTAELTGPPTSAPEDIGAGLWRAHLFPDRSRWPPVCATRERRKYLLRAERGRFLARFGGLASAGEACHSRARLLAEAGFSPPVLGLRHGFLVHPWMEGARPLSDDRSRIPRRELLARVADYLAFRGHNFPSGANRGARPHELLAMTTANASEALGHERAQRLEARFVPWLDELARQARPVEVDARLHAWEWLVLSDGRLVKTDAVDHCDGHDPIGCQDPVWDLAGAVVELELDPVETEWMRRRVRSGATSGEPEQLAFYLACYLGFQLGLHHLGWQAASEPGERVLLQAAAARYARRLDLVCQASTNQGASITTTP
jgi:hypothetical protein